MQVNSIKELKNTDNNKNWQKKIVDKLVTIWLQYNV